MALGLRRTAAIAGAVLASLAPLRAPAGVADSPIPTIKSDAKAAHVYSVPGIIKLLQLETVFFCTSLERTATTRVAVEIFGPGGGAPMNDVSEAGGGLPGNGAIDVAPGGSVTIGTGNVIGILQDEMINFLFSVEIGSARILSTSPKIMCTAMVVDRVSSPPASMASLKVIKKTTQKGE